jgi:Siphovirus Gp157
VITSVDESISVPDSEPVPTSGGVLPVTLARLTGEFLDFVNILADTDPSDAEALVELERLLNRSAAAIQDKTVAIAAVIREFEARAEIAHMETERIATHARTSRSRAAWLRDYLLKNLELLGLKRIETATAVVVIRKSPPSVTILDEAQIPDSFKEVVTSVDRTRLRRALLDHQVVAGACLVHGRHLLIR